MSRADKYMWGEFLVKYIYFVTFPTSQYIVPLALVLVVQLDTNLNTSRIGYVI